MSKRKYLVVIEESKSMIVNVKDDPDKPSSWYCTEVLLNWLIGNYGSTPFKYYELDDIEVKELECPFDYDYVKTYGLWR